MDPRLRVALVRSDRRREAVAEALSLVDDGLRAAMPSNAHVLLKVNLAGPGRPRAAVHPDAASAVVDAVLAAGAGRVVVADSGAGDRFDRLGLRGELWGRPVDFLDLDLAPADPDPIRLLAPDGSAHATAIAGPVGSADFLASSATASAHRSAGLRARA